MDNVSEMDGLNPQQKSTAKGVESDSYFFKGFHYVTTNHEH